MRSSKTIIKTGIACLLAIGILVLLDRVLYPCTYVRNDVHAITTRTFDDIYLGTSHGKMGIDPDAMEEVTGRTGHNACSGGEYPIDAYYLTRLLVETGHKPERIVYEISPGYFVREKEEGNNYLLFYHEYPVTLTKLAYFKECLLPCNIRTWAMPWYEYPLSYELSKLGETWENKWTGNYSAAQFSTDAQAYRESGFIARYEVDTSLLTTDGMEAPAAEDIMPGNLNALTRLIELCRQEDIGFVAVTTPLPLPYLQAFAQQYQALWQVFGAYFDEQDVTWINFNDEARFNLFTHDIRAFTDMDGHLNENAASAFSRVLAQELENISQGA